jgi:hypothetical protein
VTGAIPLYLGNDYDLTLSGVKKESTGDYTDGTATATWLLAYEEGDGTIQSGSLSYVNPSNGDYSAVLQSSDFAAVPIDTRVYLRLTISQDGYDGEWNQTMKIARRQAS